MGPLVTAPPVPSERRDVTRAVRTLRRIVPSPGSVRADDADLLIGLVRVLAHELTPTQRAEMAAILGLQPERGPGWAHVRAWLDRAFKGTPVVRTTTDAAYPAVIEADRILLRVGDLEVAHLRRRSWARHWSGAVAEYSPGANSISPSLPDALCRFTERTIRVRVAEVENRLETKCP